MSDFDKRLRSVWSNMKKRCSPTNKTGAKYYSDRGIKVCERWQDFDAFAEDMGPHPGKGWSIDRIDPDGHYEPSNCRWATRKTQQQNRRFVNNLTVGDETHCVTEWSRRSGIPVATINSRIKAGWDLADAVSLQQGTREAANYTRLKRRSIERYDGPASRLFEVRSIAEPEFGGVFCCGGVLELWDLIDHECNPSDFEFREVPMRSFGVFDSRCAFHGEARLIVVDDEEDLCAEETNGAGRWARFSDDTLSILYSRLAS